MRAIASKSKAVTTTAQTLANFGFSAAEIARATGLHVSTITNAAMYRYDGSAPTASVGHPLPADSDKLLYDAPLIQQFRIISKTGTANVLITLLEP